MNRPTVLRNSAEPEVVIGIALKIYYNHNDWVSNAVFLDQLDHEYELAGKKKESRSGGQMVAKYKPSLYYGLLEGRSEDDHKRINEFGKKYYEAYLAGDSDQMVDCLLHAISIKTFGRNNAAVPKSDSNIEPPKVYLVSSLLLNGLSKTEYSYIIEQLSQDRDFQVILVDVIVARQVDNELPLSEYAKNNYGDDKGIKFMADAGLFEERDGFRTIKQKYILKYADLFRNLSIFNTERKSIQPSGEVDDAIVNTDTFENYLAALRTKPFMLLAGISGTGKSRIVREFAFKSCPPALQDAEGTTPGNYCMIEVKPNWHDSTEILGYYSNISKKYHFTKFVKFLVKAMMFPDVPFFVCLDEMNLAPVEQYFAEFLSVSETRKKDKETEIIQSGVLVAPEYFAPILNADSGNGYIAKYLCPEINVNIPHDVYTNKSLTTIGLTLPDNVFIIGTVNMDDTTHQFSRKVIDRAMTIEMNGGKLEDMFGHSADLQYLPENQIMKLSAFKPKYVNADEVMEEHSDVAEFLQEKLVEKLDKINDCLKNTPFQVSYRVLNELCIYAGVLLDDGEDIDNAISKAVDQITLMKILPRIEGDEDMFVLTDKEQIDTSKINNKLEQLQEILGKDSASGVKLEEMKERLKNSSFTRFWP